jgi:hypothetical protein
MSATHDASSEHMQAGMARRRLLGLAGGVSKVLHGDAGSSHSVSPRLSRPERSRPMHLKSTTRIAVTALLVAAVVGLSPSAQGQSAGNAVTDWNQIAVSTLVGLPGPAGGAPAAAPINVGMVQGAVYDAVNAIEPKHHRPYLLKRRFAATASKEAAVATAAYTVLSNIVSTVPASIPFPSKESVLQSLASQYASSLGAIPDSPFKAQGVAAGKAAAEAMIAAKVTEPQATERKRVMPLARYRAKSVTEIRVVGEVTWTPERLRRRA